jgi:hypothetical protein
LLDHDPFRIASAASHFRVDIILPIASSWKAPFSVMEVPPTDITREWCPTSLFQLLEQGIGLLRRRCEPGWIVCSRG